MSGRKGFDGLCIEGGIAVAASMPAGVVLADVNALQAAAFRTLVRVLLRCHGPAGQFRDQIPVHAAAVGDAMPLQIHLLRTGAQPEAILARDGSESGRDPIYLPVRADPDVQPPEIGLHLVIQVDEAEHAVTGGAFQGGGHGGELFNVPVRCILLRQHNGIVPPHHML